MIEEVRKILVVDDDPFVREMLAMILQSSDYLVETAENGADAFGICTSDSSYNLVISDMNMPEMSGLALIERLRQDNIEVPVIILTGNNEISVAIEAMNLGANDYLLKDENIQDTILISVEKVLEKDFLKKQNIRLMEDLALKNERLEQEKMLAQKVQKNILPRQLSFKGFEIATFYQPSDKIGGDFFDAWEANGLVHLLIGDVSGHGTSSALIMAVCKGIFQSLGHSLRKSKDIIQGANTILCDVINDMGMFISLVYALFNRENNQLEILSAGHNPVVLFRAGDKRIQTIESTGPVLGWDPHDSWNVVNFPFNHGDTLFYCHKIQLDLVLSIS